MTGHNEVSKIRQAAGAAMLIGSIAVGVFTIDARYAKSAEFEKYTQQVEKAINKIYVQQLRQEEREIGRIPETKMTEIEKRRLEDIRREIEDLQKK